MKAAWYEKTGDADKVLKVGQIADPTPNKGEVLVELKTSGINPSIHLMLKQELGQGVKYSFRKSFHIQMEQE